MKIVLPESHHLLPHTPFPKHPFPENLPRKLSCIPASLETWILRNIGLLPSSQLEVPPGSCLPPSHQHSVGLMMTVLMTSPTLETSKCLWNVSYIMGTGFLRTHLSTCLPHLEESFHSADGVFDQGNYGFNAIQPVSHSGIGTAH